jgi:hypothetical protein
MENNYSLLASISFFKAICAFVGIASSNDSLEEGFKPFCSKVHTPFGPLQSKKIKFKVCIKIVNKKKEKACNYRKSGIPAAVLIPAPV